MFQNCSKSSKKRQSTDTGTIYNPLKKIKFEESSIGCNQSKPTDVEGATNKATKLVSLILVGQNRNVQNYPSQLVWCRTDKTPFWPAMVWPCHKSDRVSEDEERVLVKFFVKNNASIWMKLENVFPFDGLESFDKMKHSVDQSLLTQTMKSDFEFAFNTTNELWSRAVAEAICCMYKNREEKQALFLTFSLSVKNPPYPTNVQRRSVRLIEHSVSNKVNDELDRIRSFIKPISVPIVETPDTGKIQGENLLRKFVAESVSFRKFGFNKVCNICVTSTPNDDGQLVKCSGTCDGYVHRKCFANRFSQRLAGRDDDRGSTQPVCDDCRKESEGFCFICKTDDDSFKSQTINCTFSDCLRRYHVSCLKNWPQTKWNGNDDQNVTFICPLHECHQCRSNDYCETNLATCIKCPTAFHTQAACTQAGTVRLSNSHIICIKHCQLRKIRTNLNYCYICKTGHNLLRCFTCPHSYHKACVPSTHDSTSKCTKCSSGQHPLYGDFVWAKLFTYPWWPAIIIPPHCIPGSILNEKHSSHSVGVCFFGDHTVSWINRQLVHPFDEDNSVLHTQMSRKFTEAVSSARKWVAEARCLKLKDKTYDHVIPSPYTSIEENVAVLPASITFDDNNLASICNCNENDLDPCGVSSDCLNSLLYIECNELCPAGVKCRNKCIQQKKYANVKLKHFGDKGFGLVSSEWIPSKTIIQQYTGELITSSECDRRMQDPNRSNVYFMQFSKDYFIDAESMGSVVRYVNHSCNPNSEFHFYSVNGVNVVVVLAMEDIPPDNEITCKYDWSRNIPCLCNEANCTGFC